MKWRVTGKMADTNRIAKDCGNWHLRAETRKNGGKSLKPFARSGRSPSMSCC